MKLKTLTFLLIIFFFKTASAQSDTFKIMVGEDDIALTQYYKSLMRLFPENNYLKIEKDVDNDGGKTLKLELPTDREGKVGFVMTFSRFFRFNDGREICSQQLFLCDNSSAVNYLSYIKDNFKYVEVNKWVKKLDDTFEVLAIFRRGEDTVSSISFYLQVKKK